MALIVGFVAVLLICIVLADTIIPDWGPTAFVALDESHMGRLAALDAEVVLLGTGRILLRDFIHADLLERAGR